MNHRAHDERALRALLGDFNACVDLSREFMRRNEREKALRCLLPIDTSPDWKVIAVQWTTIADPGFHVEPYYQLRVAVGFALHMLEKPGTIPLRLVLVTYGDELTELWKHPLTENRIYDLAPVIGALRRKIDDG